MKLVTRLCVVVSLAMLTLSCDAPIGVVDGGAQLAWVSAPPATLREGDSATVAVELRDTGGQPLLDLDGALVSLRFAFSQDSQPGTSCGEACTTTVDQGRAQITVAWVSAGSWTASACVLPAGAADSVCVDAPLTVIPVQAVLVTFPAASVERRVDFPVEARLRLPDGTPVTDMERTVRLRFTSAAPAAGHVSCPEAGPLCERAAVAGVVRLDNVVVLDTEATTLEACAIAPNGHERCDGAGPRAFSVVLPQLTLRFVTEPGGGSVGVPFDQQPTVEALEPDGTRRADFDGSIAVALDAGVEVGSALAGTGHDGVLARGIVTAQAVAGLATFPDLRINQAGLGYRLVASITGAVPDTSGLFDGVLDAEKLTLAKLAGDNQLGRVATALLVDPTVLVSGPLGDPITGVVVSFSIVGVSAGGCRNDLATTDLTGTASCGQWTLAIGPGANSLAAGSEGFTQVTFLATGVGVLAEVAFVTQPTNVVAGAYVTPQVVVELRDALHHRVFWATDEVSLEGRSNAEDILGGVQAVAAVDGRATFDNLWIKVAGTHRISGVTGAFRAVSEPFVVSPRTDVLSLSLAAGNNQTAVAGTAVATAPTVLLEDVYGNKVPGQTVMFAAVVGGGSVTGGVQVTDADGLARPDAWTLGLVPGLNTLSAKAEGVADSVVFFAYGTAPTFNAGSVSAGYDFTCATSVTHLPYCWGDNTASQLGEGTQTARSRPTQLSGGLLQLTQVSAGYRHACGLSTNGAAYCWGNNFYGQLGIDTADVDQHSTPDLVTGGHTFQQISAGFAHVCALDTDGAVWCWGANSDGELGVGVDRTGYTHPLRVASLLRFTQVAVGALTSCALTDTGDIWCWGNNGYGQLGNNSVVGQSFVPVLVSGGRTWTQVSVGFQHVCGVSASAVYCWGRNQSGQLGIGSTTPGWSLVPVPALGVLGVTRQVAAGTLHTCAVTAAGETYCWGDNTYGQLGDFTTTARTSGVRVTTDAQFVAITAGSQHTCARRQDGGATFCWGSNSLGRLGIGTSVGNYTVPVQVVLP